MVFDYGSNAMEFSRWLSLQGVLTWMASSIAVALKFLSYIYGMAVRMFTYFYG